MEQQYAVCDPHQHTLDKWDSCAYYICDDYYDRGPFPFHLFFFWVADQRSSDVFFFERKWGSDHSHSHSHSHCRCLNVGSNDSNNKDPRYSSLLQANSHRSYIIHINMVSFSSYGSVTTVKNLGLFLVTMMILNMGHGFVLVTSTVPTCAQTTTPITASSGFAKRAKATTRTTTSLRMNAVGDFFQRGKIALVKGIAGDYDETAIRKRLDALISENSVLMLSFTTCPYCLKAKEILNAQPALSSGKDPVYTIVELDQDVDGKAIRAVLGDLVGRTSVPAIWIDGVFVGGCNDGGPDGSGLVQLEKSGRLNTMLQAALS